MSQTKESGIKIKLVISEVNLAVSFTFLLISSLTIDCSSVVVAI